MDHFVLVGEHTVVDKQNKLMWARTDSMNDMEKWVNYQDSVDYVRTLCDKKIAGDYLLEMKWILSIMNPMLLKINLRKIFI